MRDLSRRSLLLGAALGAGAVVAGCTSPTVTPSTSTSPLGTPSTVPVTPTPTPTPVDSRPRWPLTGALMDDPAAGQHAAIAVKVPDNKFEHPQTGIDTADIVFVQMDGYVDSHGQSSTRLMPVYHSVIPQDVGPVRSVRPVDVPLLAPMTAIIANCDGTDWVLNFVAHNSQYMDGSLSYMNTRGTGAYDIDPKRVYTANGKTQYDRAVICHPPVFGRLTSNFSSGPQTLYLPFATGDAQPSTVGGAAANEIKVPWKTGDTYDMTYTWDANEGRYLRSMPWGPHVVVGGNRVKTDNVLIIRTVHEMQKLDEGKDGPEVMHDIIQGTGTFVYAYQGAYVTGSWRKGDVADGWQFTLDNGQGLVMGPGQTYVELPDIDADVRIS